MQNIVIIDAKICVVYKINSFLFALHQIVLCSQACFYCEVKQQQQEEEEQAQDKPSSVYYVRTSHFIVHRHIQLCVVIFISLLHSIIYYYYCFFLSPVCCAHVCVCVHCAFSTLLVCIDELACLALFIVWSQSPSKFGMDSKSKSIVLDYLFIDDVL